MKTNSRHAGDLVPNIVNQHFLQLAHFLIGNMLAFVGACKIWYDCLKN